MERRCPEGWGCVGGDDMGGCEGMQELRVGSCGSWKVGTEMGYAE